MRTAPNLSVRYPSAARYARTVLGEARSLFNRRKAAYAAIALFVLAAYLMAAGLNNPLDPSHAPAASAQQGEHPMTIMQPDPFDSAGATGSTAAGNSSEANTSTNVTDTTVTVNGQNIPLPMNGTVHQTVVNGGGTTTIDASQHASGGGAGSHTSTTLHLDVHSDGSSEGG